MNHATLYVFAYPQIRYIMVSVSCRLTLSLMFKKKSCKITFFDYTFMLLYDIKCVRQIVTQLLHYCYNITPASVCLRHWETGDNE